MNALFSTNCYVLGLHSPSMFAVEQMKNDQNS